MGLDRNGINIIKVWSRPNREPCNYYLQHTRTPATGPDLSPGDANCICIEHPTGRYIEIIYLHLHCCHDHSSPWPVLLWQGINAIIKGGVVLRPALQSADEEEEEVYDCQCDYRCWTSSGWLEYIILPITLALGSFNGQHYSPCNDPHISCINWSCPH